MVTLHKRMFILSSLFTMTIALKKFGTTLISHPDGREALLAFDAAFRNVSPDETLDVDFTEVLTLGPGWATEFLTPLQTRFGDRLRLRTSDNPSVKATLKILAQTNNRAWRLI